MSENEHLWEENHRLQYACVKVFRMYEGLVCAIKRDRKLSEQFKLWMLGDKLRDAYSSVLNALFWDEARFEKEITKLKADEEIIRACQIFNWSAAAVLDGYREQTDFAIKNKLMPKKTAERMYENFKKKFEKEELPDRLALSFERALVRIGERELREIYETLGEDFYAAYANYKRYEQKRKAEGK